MGFGFRELIVILFIALLIFGAKRLRSIGSDLGGAISGFRKGLAPDDEIGGAAGNLSDKNAPVESLARREGRSPSD
jgi:sec-independent protein translocase protein TatA